MLCAVEGHIEVGKWLLSRPGLVAEKANNVRVLCAHPPTHVYTYIHSCMDLHWGAACVCAL